MADFDTGDIVRLGAQMTLNLTDEVVGVWHVRIEAGGPMAFAAAGQDFQEYIDGIYRPLVAYYTTAITSNYISVKNQTQATVWGSIAWNPSFTGTSVGERVTPQVALLAWGRTAKSRVQIRKYFGPFTDGNIAQGVWDAGTTAACAAVMSWHIGTQTMTNGLQLKGVAYNRTAGTYNYGLGATATNNPVIQRRRRQGRGA